LEERLDGTWVARDVDTKMGEVDSIVLAPSAPPAYSQPTLPPIIVRSMYKSRNAAPAAASVMTVGTNQ
jgi:hypothetical protein